MPLSIRSNTNTLLLLLLILFPSFAASQGEASPFAAQLGYARIAWDGKPKISRYRLQLARNEKFDDIVFDKLVEGREYKVTEIPPGSYFWRVAPAAGETGAYSKPIPVTVSGPGKAETTEVTKPTVLGPPADIGWRTATGIIEQPVAALLRAGSSHDLVGVNSYGMIYAISGENGVALWSARYRPSAKKGEPTNSDGSPAFAPVLIEKKDKTVNVVVAFDGGVRALDGATGRELWRAVLTGEPLVGGALTGSDGSVAIAVSDNSRTLTFFNGDSGQVISQAKLDGFVVGRPVELSVKNERAVLMALNNGTIDVRNLAGVNILAIKLDSTITAGALVVRAPRGPLVMLGTEAGLVALNAADLTPLWRVATESDAPAGILSSANLDADGGDEVVMVTRRGRVVVVNVATGKIKWYADGATDATKASFADVNGDGAMDVLLAGGTAFAVGYSGKDGQIVWRADEPASSRPPENVATPRALVTAPFGSGGALLLIGTDSARSGLRAVGLRPGVVK